MSETKSVCLQFEVTISEQVRNVSVWNRGHRERAKVLGFSICLRGASRVFHSQNARIEHRSLVFGWSSGRGFGRVVLELHPTQCGKPSVKEVERLRVQISEFENQDAQ
jgi:hypothetical protein